MRRSWIGDYLDPNTFLSCWITGDGNNRSGWSSARYDGLLRQAAREPDAHRRFALLYDAEALLLDEGPTLPVYHYSTNELVKPYVRGIYQTVLDVHPLTNVWIDRDWRRHAGEPPQALAAPDAHATAPARVAGTPSPAR
jgi:oligopeptide transport system substrate-binding protein